MLIFFVKKSATVLKIFYNVWRHVSNIFKTVADFLTKKLSMLRIPIYIIDYVIFWPPSPRATNKFGIKCAFLLTQTVLYGQSQSVLVEAAPSFHNVKLIF